MIEYELCGINPVWKRAARKAEYSRYKYVRSGIIMGLRVEKVAKSDSRKQVKAIYTAAFEKEDRMPFWMMLMMSYLRNTDFLAFFDGETLCGFVYMATNKKLTFVMFFAVDASLRSKGYGGRILAQLQAMYPDKKLIVSIEPCDGSARDIKVRLRRKSFYLNNGFSETGYHIRLGKEQELLIKNGLFDKREFTQFFMLYSNFMIIPKVWAVSAE